MTLLPLIKMGSPRLKNWKGNGSLKNIMKPKLIIIKKINGFEYTESEELEALRKKGYTILPYRTYTETPIHGSSFTKDWYDTKCAVKDGQTPSDENIWQNVAIKEFQKEFIKPKLL
jgi:hypothetical protein